MVDDEFNNVLNTPLNLPFQENKTEEIKDNHAAGVDILFAPDVNVHAKNQCEKTALVCAAKKGYASVAHILLAHGADVNVKNQCDKTALMYAGENGNAAILELFYQSDY